MTVLGLGGGSMWIDVVLGSFVWCSGDGSGGSSVGGLVVVLRGSSWFCDCCRSSTPGNVETTDQVQTSLQGPGLVQQFTTTTTVHSMFSSVNVCP